MTFFYLFFFLFIFLISLLEWSALPQRNRYFLYLSILSVNLLAGCRWGNGPDWETYYDFYTTGDNVGLFEPLFVCFVNIFRLLGINYSVFLFAFSAIIMFLYGRIARIYSPYPSLSILILVSLFVPFWVRQSLSCAILIYGCHMLAQNKPWQFLSAVIIASLFHSSALIALLFLFVYRKKVSAKSLMLVLLASGLMAFSSIIPWLIDSAASLGIGGSVISRVVFYLQNETLNENVNYLVRNTVSIINMGAYASLFLCARNLIPEPKLQFYNVFFNFYTFGCVINLIAMGNLDVLRRLSMPFMLIPYLLLPLVLFHLPKKWKVIFFCVIFTISIGRFFGNLSNYPTAYYPYNFFNIYTVWF